MNCACGRSHDASPLTLMHPMPWADTYPQRVLDETCMWPLSHRNKHACGCVCMKQKGHDGRHACNLDAGDLGGGPS